MSLAYETEEVMLEEIGNRNVRLTQVKTNRLRLLRDGKLSDDEYRLASAIAEDMEIYSGGSGGALQAIPNGEGYVAMPRASGRPVAPQERHEAALWRIGEARQAIRTQNYQRRTPQMRNADFEHWIRSDPTMRAFERRCHMRSGAGLEYVWWMLERVGAMQIYDEVKWRVVIRGEAA